MRGANTETAEVPLERLEAQICELAGHLAAATARFLLLIAAFDRRKGWAQWGVRSCAHWLNWKCGLGPGAAREHVRVARALAALPVLTGAFIEGRLSFSKVRALTRVATADNESTLVSIAECSTAAQLERLVSGLREAQSATATTARRARRYARYRWDADGSLLLHARLSPEDGAVVIAALRAATDLLRSEPGSEPGGTSTSPADTAETAATTEAESEPESVSAETFFAEPAPPPGTHRRRQIGADEPTLADALTTVATGFLNHASVGDPGDRYQVIIHSDQPVGETSATTIGHLENGPTLHPATVDRITCNATVVGASSHPDDAAWRAKRYPSARQRRAMRARDLGRCRYPSCTNRITDAHHIRPHHRGGPTVLRNLVSLCRAHHTLVHEGGFSVALDPDGRLAFARPDGQPVPAVPTHAPVDGTIEDTHGSTIDPRTIVGHWAGDRLDLPYAVSVLSQAVQ